MMTTILLWFLVFTGTTNIIGAAIRWRRKDWITWHQANAAMILIGVWAGIILLYNPV